MNSKNSDSENKVGYTAAFDQLNLRSWYSIQQSAEAHRQTKTTYTTAATAYRFEDFESVVYKVLCEKGYIRRYHCVGPCYRN